MKKTVLGIGLLVGGLLVVSSVQAGQDKDEHAGDKSAKEAAPKTEQAAKEVTLQTTCPAMGGNINKNVYVDHDGKRIYLCCKGCTAAVKKEPAKYIKKLEDAGVTLDTVPKPEADEKAADGHAGHKH